jgi:4-amino-4-deoxy-L-arabinose transferase-like glycosyltransferase
MFYKKIKEHPWLPITFLYLAICLWQLEAIPGEWYGDISIEHEYVQDILRGNWKLNYELSAGPAYHYLISPLIRLIGPDFTSYKLASILTGMAGIIGVYLLTKKLTGRWTGVFGMILTGTSFVYILFSRLGSSPQMLTPVLAVYAVYWALRYIKEKRPIYLLIGVVTSSLGLFTYPASWPLPLIYLGIISIGSGFKTAFRASLTFIPALWLFGLSIYQNPADFFQGYIGSKVIFWGNPITRVGTNFIKALGMWQINGDVSFRTNLSGRPIFDPLTGGMFWIGLWYWAKRGKEFWYLFVPLSILILPAMAPGIPIAEIPSNSRTLAAIPFAYMLAAGGLYQIIVLFRSARAKLLVTGDILMVIIVINILTYFGAYPNQLPDHNTPYGKIIADFIDHLPPKTPVFIASSGWGEWGQPEAKGVFYRLKNQTERQNILEETVEDCRQIPSDRDAMIIIDPQDLVKIEYFKRCFPRSRGASVSDTHGQKIFYQLETEPG